MATINCVPLGAQDKVTRMATLPPPRQMKLSPPPGRKQREAKKAQTRARIVEAARDLFAERGYHASTVRDITARAGVSSGSLFTSFSGKAALLQEIVNARLEGLLEHAQGALERGQGAAAILAEMGQRAYAYEGRELRLLAESIGASWTWDADTEAANRQSLSHLLGTIRTVLAAGQTRGDLAPDADLTLLTHTIFSCYLQNFRLAIYDGWPPERLADLLGAQIKLVLSGAGRGCA
jgi:AcrR family transcriptional regulator